MENIDDLTSKYERLHSAILGMDDHEAAAAAGDLLASRVDPNDVIDSIIRPTADEIGDKFQREEFFLPQLMLAGNALDAAMSVLLKAIPASGEQSKKTVLIGTVKGDIHTIGKNIVAMMLRTGGFDVQDLGVDVDASTFVKEAVAREADIIALSSLLTTTLPYQRDVISELKSQRLRDRFRVLIGGGPATQEWADEIGADGYGKDAGEALAVARRITGGE